MYLIRVTDPDLASEFINLPAHLNRQHRVWSKSQQKHIKALIKRKSAFFESGEAEFWIITNFRGETIGRIAAFVEHPLPSENKRGYIGLFDCINHLKATSLLFDACKDWFKQFDVDVMEGPISFLPFQIQGVALEAGFRQSTPFFASQTDYLASLYQAYGFKVCDTRQLLKISSVSSLLNEHSKSEAKAFLYHIEYDFLKVNKNELKPAVEDIQALYKVVYKQNMLVPSTEDIVQWLHMLFEQHYPPVIGILYRQKVPIAFMVNAFISSQPDIEQHETVFQHLVARFSSKNKSLLNLGWIIHPDYQTLATHTALLSILDEALNHMHSSAYDSFLIMNDSLEHSLNTNSEAEILDTFVKFEYQFDQEDLIDTFVKSKKISRD